MSNRATRRKKEKFLKKRLTDDQYTKLTDEANASLVNDHVEKRVIKFMTEFSQELGNVMRANSISQNRATKIITEAYESYIKKLENEDGEHDEKVS